MAIKLELKVKTTNEFIIKEREYTKIIVDVVAKGKDVKNASVSFAIKNGLSGTLNPTSCTTNKYGNCETIFNADETGRYEIEITATKTGFTDGSFTIEIISLDDPVEYSSKNVLYLNIIEQRKKDLLKELRNYLDNDKEFYKSTGATDRITYLTEWNFAVKDFPLIVASNEGPEFKLAGINNIIDNQTFGGFVNINLGLNIVAENKNILDRLTEKCIFILGTLKRLELYGKYGLWIESISTGGLATEEYGARMLFANKITLNTRLELVHNIIVKDSIESINTSGQSI